MIKKEIKQKDSKDLKVSNKTKKEAKVPLIFQMKSIIYFTVQCWWLTTIHSVDFWDSETEMSAIVLGISGKISSLDKKGVGVFLLKGSKSRAL